MKKIDVKKINEEFEEFIDLDYFYAPLYAAKLMYMTATKEQRLDASEKLWKKYRLKATVTKRDVDKP